MPPEDDRRRTDPDFPTEALRRAGDQGLGAPLDARREVGGLPAVVTGVVVAVGSLALLLGVGAVGEAADASPLSGLFSLLRFVALFFFFSFVWGVVYAVRGAIIGTRVTYLFAGGLVHRRRSSYREVAWPEVEALESVIDKRTQGKEGKVLGYRVKVAGSAPDFVVPLLLEDGRDSFIDRVVDELATCGRPVR
jgi:hypothetical protein